MTRLTFGVTSSPFLATQVLRQLAEDHRKNHPLAADAINFHFYVDDYLTGADSHEAAISLREDLSNLLQRGQMKLRKFRTNIPELRAEIPLDLLESDNLDIRASPGSSHKALGLHRKTSSDTLHVSTPQVSQQQVCSKRTVASLAAKVFDVLEWFSPVVVVAKLIIR